MSFSYWTLKEMECVKIQLMFKLGFRTREKSLIGLIASILRKLMDGWMICDFTLFSVVFQSYQDVNG